MDKAENVTCSTKGYRWGEGQRNVLETLHGNEVCHARKCLQNVTCPLGRNGWLVGAAATTRHDATHPIRDTFHL